MADRTRRWTPSRARVDPVLLLEQFAMSRDRDVMPVRYTEMARSPFAFNRGAAVIMASDLASEATSGLRVQLCGDAHVCNFGVFLNAADTPGFDIREFDETLPGPWEWDVKRLAVSLEIARRRGSDSVAARRRIVRASVDAYAAAMKRHAEEGYLQILYGGVAPPRLELHLDRDRPDTVDRRVKSRPRLLTNSPSVDRIHDAMPADEAALLFGRTLLDLEVYKRTLGDDRRTVLERHELRDVAFELGDIPTMGLHSKLLLLVETGTDEPLLLEVREAQRSILEAYAGRSRYGQAGRRVVEGMRLIKTHTDALAGAMRRPAMDGTLRDYYVRQWTRPVSIWDVERISPGELRRLGEACAMLLARAHALSGDRVAIARYLGSSSTFTDAVENFASSYADQNLRDYESFLAAVDRGRIIVRRAA